tara:strand:+ start:223 stop:543 length:321 start_codon:yes stop_codon:yes gene_type:complete
VPVDGVEGNASRHSISTQIDTEVFGDLRVVEEDEELEGLEDRLVVDELLGEEARGREHGQAAVLELLRLHLGELGRVRGLEAERVEADVARVVVLVQNTGLRGNEP